ncbi:non-canonical purine NTP pyrophosphatase [Caedimonas varicaedens]|uniref:Non-canonical purine NTP pyrophosphatase n=1 Tax=Caedimonas varicaedens TaxID=1629334 RepID=A0A0K8MEY5_9PROT|nr:non-canonical purine NTP pyrophosphatase [Caedimonas varicaedens]
MISFSTLLLASHNRGKIEELRMLVPSPVRIQCATDFSDEEPAETGCTFRENAAIKARFWQQKTGLPCLADDAGICIDVLNGAPGVDSKGFIDSHGGREKMFDALAQNKDIQTNPRSYCISVLALALSNGDLKFYEGQCQGELVFPPRGSHGHGYDPIFKPLGSPHTYAEMTVDEKNRWSHRAKAFQLFLADHFS